MNHVMDQFKMVTDMVASQPMVTNPAVKPYTNVPTPTTVSTYGKTIKCCCEHSGSKSIIHTRQTGLINISQTSMFEMRLSTSACATSTHHLI